MSVQYTLYIFLYTDALNFINKRTFLRGILTQSFFTSRKEWKGPDAIRIFLSKSIGDWTLKEGYAETLFGRK